jgi:putative spermidine/putrescine transport system substrate-binding protein
MSTIPLYRRRLLKIGAAAASLPLIGMPRLVRAQDKPLTGKTVRLLTWADDTGTAQLKNIVAPFEERTGAKVIADRTGGTSSMVAKLKAAGDRPTYDVITLSGAGATALAAAGLLAKPDQNKIPNLQDVSVKYRFGADGYAIGYLLWTNGLIYSTKTYSSPPDSYSALWDKNVAKNIFLPPADYLESMQTVVMAARFAGGDQSNPEPGFKKLEELKDRVVMLGENPNQVADLFRSGSLDLGGLYSPAFFPQAVKDPSYNMSASYAMKEGFYTQTLMTVIPRSRPGDDDAVYEFVNQTIDPVSQGKMAEDILNGAVNGKAVLSEAARNSPYIPTPEQIAEHATTHDEAQLAKTMSDWTRRYTEIFA